MSKEHALFVKRKVRLQTCNTRAFLLNFNQHTSGRYYRNDIRTALTLARGKKLLSGNKYDARGSRRIWSAPREQSEITFSHCESVATAGIIPNPPFLLPALPMYFACYILNACIFLFFFLLLLFVSVSRVHGGRCARF